MQDGLCRAWSGLFQAACNSPYGSKGSGAIRRGVRGCQAQGPERHGTNKNSKADGRFPANAPQASSISAQENRGCACERKGDQDTWRKLFRQEKEKEVICNARW